jgi:glycogen operon protein
LISEPWDTGPGGYQLGNHPPGFTEWNDQFRDAVRRFWRGDAGMRGTLASRLMGTPEVFDGRHRRPWESINFLSAHDGFTAWDVVSYNEKHNEANGDDNNDGHSENFSANWGVEGPTDNVDILAIRERVLRAMLATVMLSAGTPMLLAGDEFGNSQQGNNNSYCQDNELSWLDWQDAKSERGEALTAFISRLAALRRDHPSLRPKRFEDGSAEMAPGLIRVAWYDVDGKPMTPEAWEYAEGRALGLRRAAVLPSNDIDVTLLLINGSEQDVEFVLPEQTFTWEMALDSAAPAAQPETVSTQSIQVSHHALVLLTGRSKQYES